MKLKHLELHGYKSFANHTEFAFHDGVTAIVGPNGSGKSNVADAIQWVLGEQSFSNLRAKKTEDMIFAGSSMRVRMGMAEVSLTLDNSANWLPIEFSEVTITRRAYRSGENEYLLNGTKMRLRDIAELLSKGGLGRGSYTVIGQGLIDSAISLRPEERRSLLEDAAGISLYQSKKADALSKLSATQDNLTRVGDIMRELGPRVKRLADQANRASQFEDVQRKLAERLQTWYGYQWQLAQAKLAEAERIGERAEAELRAAREGLQTSDVERAQLRERIQAQRRTLAEWQRQLGEHQRAQQELSQRRAVAQERLGLLTQQREDLLRELDALRVEEQSATLAQSQFAAESENLQASEREASERFAQLRDAMQRRDAGRRSINVAQAEAQQSALALAAQIAEHTQRIAGARQRLQLVAAESAQQKQTFASHAVEARAFDERVAAARKELDALAAQLDERTAQLAEAQQQASALQKQVAELGAQLAEAQAQSRGAQVELDSARGRGVKHLLDAARESLVNIIGPLQSLYRVAPEHDQIVRGALGAHADALVAPTWRDAEQLAARARARQVILVLESFAPEPPPLSPPPPALREVTHEFANSANQRGEMDADFPSPVGHPERTLSGAVAEPKWESKDDGGGDKGGGVSALSLITCAPEHRAMFEALLARVHVGEDGVPRVNAHGTLITQHAILTADQDAPNLSALEVSASDWQTRARDCAERLERARGDEAQAITTRDAFSAERYALEGERAKRQSELDGMMRARERLRQESERATGLLERWQSEQASIAPQLAEWEQALAASQLQQSALTPPTLAAAEENDNQALARQVAQQETRAALLQQELQARQPSLAQLVARIQSLAAQQQQKTQRADNLSGETDRLRDEIAQADEQIAQIVSQVEPLQAQMQPAAAQLGADEAALRDLETQERAAREALYAAEAAHSQALVELQRRQDRQVTLREQIESDYEFVSLTTDLPTALALELGDKTLNLPHVTAAPDGMEQEIRSLKNKMRWIGNVNLEAPSEHALEKARHEFLTVQSTDLQRASESLHQLVTELDGLMQQKFRETFDAVARAFKEYFTRLFGGGSAELVLTEPENLITTGVDIIAHPPGKRRQPLGLLSGGERALTACALIFALLKASPTPFCVLDEVDAALDEANVSRFRSTLRELSERTQFIVVTHNRGTIEVAGAVYGISMGADGASQMISLRLDGVEVKERNA